MCCRSYPPQGLFWQFLYQVFPQARAIENAMDGMLTSEPIETMDVGVPPSGVLAEVYMFGTKLVMNTDVNTITQKISVFITDTQLALVTA